MTTHTNRETRCRDLIVAKWQEFWFEKEPAYTLGLVRVALGAVMIVWTLAKIYNRNSLFSPAGPLERRSGLLNAGVLDFCHTDGQVLLVLSVLLAAAISLTVGWWTNVSAVVVLVLMHAFIAGYFSVSNSGDRLLAIEVLVLAASPCGAALSLDQRRRADSFWSAQQRSHWAIRMLQVQLSFIYLVGVIDKLGSSKAWFQGTAVYYAWVTDLRYATLPPPQWLYDSPLLVNAITWGTVLVELALGILVWNRRCRPWILLTGVGLHIGIMVTMAVGSFTPAILVPYLAFLSPETVRRLPDIVRPSTRKLQRNPEPATNRRTPEPL